MNEHTTQRLFREHVGYLKTFLHVRMGLPHAIVDDAIQEVFIVVDRLGGYKPGPAKPRTWLTSIAIKVASNIRRSEHRKTGRLDHTENLERFSNHILPPDVQLDHSRKLQTVWNQLEALEPHLKDTLSRFALGASCNEIASELNIPIGTVYSRVHEARKRLTMNSLEDLQKELEDTKERVRLLETQLSQVRDTPKLDHPANAPQPPLEIQKSTK